MNPGPGLPPAVVATLTPAGTGTDEHSSEGTNGVGRGRTCVSVGSGEGVLEGAPS